MNKQIEEYKKAQYLIELERKQLNNEPLSYCNCCGARYFSQKDIDHDQECLYYNRGPKNLLPKARRIFYCPR